MSNFAQYAKSQYTGKRKRTTIARLWSRKDGFTSGNSDKEATYWVSENALFSAPVTNAPLKQSTKIADLTEGEEQAYGSGEMVPVLKGFLKSGQELIVKANTKEQKVERVELARQSGNADASIERMPDLYIQLLSLEVTSEPASAEFNHSNDPSIAEEIDF